MRTWRPTLALVVISAFTAAAAAQMKEVKEAEGRAEGNLANAREMALTDALREAVRIGAGVDLLTLTKVRDFTLEYDRIFASAFGFVQGYTVLESGLKENGFYHVKIRATVGKGQPGMEQVLALRQLVHLKGSPRVCLDIDELIEEVPAGSGFAQSWFKAAAQEMQFQVTDCGRMGRQDDRLAARDEVFGDSRTARVRRADIAQEADFLIEGKVRGRYLGKDEGLYDSLPEHKFSMMVDLEAVWPDTGQEIATVTVPTLEATSDKEQVVAAGRHVLEKMLAGDPTKDFDGGWRIFGRIFARWITELDLGAIMRLEFAQITDSEHDRLLQQLPQTPKITAVWPREFDSRGLSFIDVESRLDATGLKSVVLEALGGAFGLDHATRHYLQFRRVEGGRMQSGLSTVTEKAPEPPAARRGTVSNAVVVDGDDRGSTVEAASPVPAASAQKKRPQPVSEARAPARPPFPGWSWGLVGAGIVLVLAGILILGRSAGRKGL